MSRNDTVQVLVRMRPTAQPAKEITVLPDGKSIRVYLGKQGTGVDGGVNNQPCEWGFTFDSVLGAPGEGTGSQEAVYDSAAKEVVESVLAGQNGTILAYGQTGAGKTHSICGTDLSSFENRGIIPRAVGHIFRAIQARPDMSFTVSLSYLEIYNEHVFDLLAVRPPASTRNPSVAHHIDLPIQEDLMGGTGISVKGLVKRMVSSEQECLDALFQGDAERTIGTHSLNEHSTRSHCIYTLYLSMRSRVESSEKVIHAKLNLVDLAGSERISHTGSTGVLLREAQAINKSLTFLEQVVVALGSKSRDHIPFRQSRLTHLLKDSLGGNTRTRVIATIHSDRANLEETISTLKFAQRMRKITNRVVTNVELDPVLNVAKLSREIRELKQELAMHDTLSNRIGVSYEAYTPEESLALRRQIAQYCRGSIDEIEIVNLRQVRETFRQFRNYVLEIQGAGGAAAAATSFGKSSAPATARQTPEPSLAQADESTMVGEMDEASSGGFGLGCVSAGSRPAPRPDSRDEPLRPKNIVQSRARAAALASGAPMPVGQNNFGPAPGRNSAPRSRGSNATGALGATQPSALKGSTVVGSPKPRNEEKTNGSGSSQTLPALRQASFSASSPTAASAAAAIRSPQSTQQQLSSGAGSQSQSMEASAFADFKTGPGFDVAQLCASAKQTWAARRRDLREASLLVNDLKRRIDVVSADLAAKKSERLSAQAAGAFDSPSASTGALGEQEEVEVLDEAEYALMQQCAAVKAEYRAAYAARMDVEAATLQAEQSVAAARVDLFGAFADWFREQFGCEPSTSAAAAGLPADGSSPREARARAKAAAAARADRAQAAEAEWEAETAGLDSEARSFLQATRDRDRTRKLHSRPIINGGRRPIVAAAFK